MKFIVGEKYLKLKWFKWDKQTESVENGVNYNSLVFMIPFDQHVDPFTQVNKI